jgi:8-amino-7-oxononanoate synthase
VERLQNRLRNLFLLYNSALVQDLINVPAKCPESPIFALFTPVPRSLAQHCQQVGFVVRAVVPPTVPGGTERVRICLHAGNSEEQVDAFVQAVKRWIDSEVGKAAAETRTMERAKL